MYYLLLVCSYIYCNSYQQYLPFSIICAVVKHRRCNLIIYIVINNMVIPPLPKELQIKAKEEVNEEPNKIADYITQLKEWISEQPHLKARTDDLWLLNFLRGSKFDLNKTKRKLEAFYKARTVIPVLFTNRDPLLPEIQELLNSGIIVPLLSENVNAVLVRWDDANPKNISALNVLKVAFMVFDIFLNENNTCIINGQHVIDDLNSFPLRIMKPMSPILLKRLVVDLQAAYPLRIKGFHCINVAFPLRLLLSLVQPFLNEKIRQRVRMSLSLNENEKVCFHQKLDFNKLSEFVPVELIPEEYGGKGSSINKITEELKEKIESYREWFLEDEKLYSKEA